MFLIFLFLFSSLIYGQCDYKLTWERDPAATDYVVFIEFTNSPEPGAFTLIDEMDYKLGAENCIITTTKDTTCTIRIFNQASYLVYGIVGFNNADIYGPMGTIQPFEVIFSDDPKVVGCEIILPVMYWRR